jgi:hypothetical protein
MYVIVVVAVFAAPARVLARGIASDGYESLKKSRRCALVVRISSAFPFLINRILCIFSPTWIPPAKPTLGVYE